MSTIKIEVDVNLKLDEGVLGFIRSLFNEEGNAAPAKTKPAAGGKAVVKPLVAATGASEEETEEITIEAIRAVLFEKKDAGKSDQIKALLGEFGVKSATNLDKKDYAAFIIKLRKL